MGHHLSSVSVTTCWGLTEYVLTQRAAGGTGGQFLSSLAWWDVKVKLLSHILLGMLLKVSVEGVSLPHGTTSRGATSQPEHSAGEVGRWFQRVLKEAGMSSLSSSGS